MHAAKLVMKFSSVGKLVASVLDRERVALFVPCVLTPASPVIALDVAQEHVCLLVPDSTRRMQPM